MVEFSSCKQRRKSDKVTNKINFMLDATYHFLIGKFFDPDVCSVTSHCKHALYSFINHVFLEYELLKFKEHSRVTLFFN